MSKYSWLLMVGIPLALVRPAHARDDKLLLPIAAVMESQEAKGKLDGSVKFRFGKDPASPKTLKSFSTPLILGKAHTGRDTAEKICNVAFLNAMTQLHSRAKKLNADAVVNIVSNYKTSFEFSSPTEFECHQGSNTTIVALRGEIVKLAAE